MFEYLPGAVLSGPEAGGSHGGLYDISGQLLYRFRLDPSGTTTVDLSRFEGGMYLLRIGTRTEKVLLNE